MANGGMAFSQAVQDMGSEPIKYGTGGRITGGVRRFDIGGDASSGIISNADYGADSGYDFGGSDYGPGDNPFSFTGNANGDDIPEIVITTDAPKNPSDGIDSLDWVNPNDILDTDFVTDGDTIPEIIITTDRPKQTDIDWGTNLISTENILITDWETETEADTTSEFIITDERPKKTDLQTDLITTTGSILITDWETETESESDTETIYTPGPTETGTETETETDPWTDPTETWTWEPPTEPPTPEPPTEPPTEEPPTEPPTDEPPSEPPTWWTDPPTYTPRRTPPPTSTPRVTVTTPPPTSTPVPRSGIYRSQYQNYANPLTMFNVSNYGQDVPTSAGYNYAASHQGIAQLNQSLRDLADKQMAQTYPDGSPKGADMNAVLKEMRAVGLTPTDLENAYYGRTTGLNTPFSVYGKNPPMQTPFSFTDVQQPQQVQAPQTVQQKQQAMSNGIFDLIKKLPK